MMQMQQNDIGKITKHRTKQVRRPWQANKDGTMQYNKNMNMMQEQNMAMAFIMNMTTTYRNEICNTIMIMQQT